MRYGDINSLPPWVIYAMWLAQVILFVLAAAGAIALCRRGRLLEAVVLGLPIVYVTAVHLPLLCESRQSLPVKPALITLAAVALSRKVITSRQNAAS